LPVFDFSRWLLSHVHLDVQKPNAPVIGKLSLTSGGAFVGIRRMKKVCMMAYVVSRTVEAARRKSVGELIIRLMSRSAMSSESGCLSSMRDTYLLVNRRAYKYFNQQEKERLLAVMNGGGASSN